jgi:hypothetical protein
VNYSQQIEIRRDAIAKLEGYVSDLNAKIDAVMDQVPCHLQDRLQQKLQPIQALISKATNGIGRLREEIKRLTCMQNFPPGLARRDCIRGEPSLSKGGKGPEGRSGQNGQSGERGKNASQLSRAEALLACLNGANGRRGNRGV